MAPLPKLYQVAELLGDGISSELSQSVQRVAAVLPFQLDFQVVDLSLENRRKRGLPLYDECVALMKRLRVALKYPTTTEEESPNAVLRERCHFAVIHRPVMTLPGLQSNFTKNLDIDVVRIATGGTYEDRGRRIGAESAVSLRVIERGPCKLAARFAFKLAMTRRTSVTSTSKYTIQKAADGLFEEVVEGVSRDYPGIPYRRELFDSLLAGIIMHPDRYGVIVCPNEYGDFLSDMACGLIGSIGVGDSSSYAFDEDGNVTLAMFDPAGGTAPDIAGKDLANPTAALLALASLLRHLGEVKAGDALRSALRDVPATGRRTADLGGTLSCSTFSAAIAERTAELLGTKALAR